MITMTGGTKFKQKDILLIPFPYTDFSEFKNRPTLVVSNDDINLKTDDIVCCAITSQPNKSPYHVMLTSDDMIEGDLRYDSWVICDKIATIEQDRIAKRFGKINNNKYNQIVETINKVIEG